MPAGSEAASGAAVPDREQVRDVVSANLCRCTGYQGIVDAVCEVAAERRKARGSTA